ncbi:MAG: hypothetical protein AB1529_02195 [Candidatus Micrarchaeota archaeon]
MAGKRKKKTAGATVTDIGEKRFQKMLADPLLRDRATKERLMDTLAEIAGGMPRELEPLLRIPDSLYLKDGVGVQSYSSEPRKGIESVASALALGATLPPEEDFAEYGIDVRRRGSSIYCTFVDKKRKVVVSEAIRSIHSGSGSWEPFLRMLKDSLETVKALEKERQKFSFVINGQAVP